MGVQDDNFAASSLDTLTDIGVVEWDYYHVWSLAGRGNPLHLGVVSGRTEREALKMAAHKIPGAGEGIDIVLSLCDGCIQGSQKRASTRPCCPIMR